MRTTKFAVIAVGLFLLAAPAFAADDTTPNFHALSGLTADVQAAPTLLTDEQLATVEGGTHITTARVWLNVAAFYQDPAFGNNLGIARLAQSIALGSLIFTPPHVSSGSFDLPVF